jgi:IPT/TIG domain
MKAFSVVGWLAAVVLLVAMAFAIIKGPANLWSPSVWGILALLLAYALSVGATGSLNPLAIGAGDDGKLSLSKSQTLFWTYIVLYAFAAIYARDAQLCAVPGGCPASAAAANTAGTPSDIGTNALIPVGFPNSVLLLLGFSVTSLVAAAGITRSQLAAGQISKHTRRAGEQQDLSPRWLILGDNEQVDLTRFQVVLWTLAAAGAFISDTHMLLARPDFIQSLPDVGMALVLLMGVGQAAYVGGKLVVTPKARIFRVGPLHGAAGTAVTVSGFGFGPTQAATSMLLMDGAPVPAANITSWSDSAIVFTVPNAPPGGGAWPAPPANTTVQITVALGSVETDPVPFTVP